MNKNIIYVVLAVLVLIGGVYYLSMNNVKLSDTVPSNVVATTTDTASASTTTTIFGSVEANTGTQGSVKTIPGYPSSWPSDVPKYPNGVVSEKAGNNPKSLPNEAGVVFTTKDSVKTVVNFYLNGLVANGWTITEDGAGTGNMVTFRATKAKRSVGGYVLKETDGKTEATIGVNIGL